MVDERENPVKSTSPEVAFSRQSGEYILQGDDRVWKNSREINKIKEEEEGGGGGAKEGRKEGRKEERGIERRQRGIKKEETNCGKGNCAKRELRFKQKVTKKEREREREVWSRNRARDGRIWR